MDSVAAVHSPCPDGHHGPATGGTLHPITAPHIPNSIPDAVPDEAVPAGVGWYIAPVAHWTRPHRTGHAPTRAQAWLAALTTGRAALLADALDDLAVAVDDALPLAHYYPARDDAGRLDGHEVTADMVEVYQSQVAGEIAAKIAAD